jgi:homoserine dehydrogenase
MSEINSAYYLRLRALDKPGVLADVTRILGDLDISIDAMIQKEPAEGEDQADIVLLTHITQENNIDHAITELEALESVSGKIKRIRLEHLNG